MTDVTGNIPSDTNLVQWDQLIEAVLSEHHVDIFASIPKENLKFILNPMNRYFIVQSVLASLIKTDNPKATASYANEITDLIIKLASEFSEK